MLVDLHVHTLLSSDSNVAPELYVEAAARGPRRLDAICFTEHRLFPTEADLDRRYAELTEKLADETRHARLVMDLLQEITGKKITPRQLTWLPEDRKLARVRAKYSKSYAALLHGSDKLNTREIKRRDEGLERAAITLTEGGGGALYQVCAKLKKNGVERKIASVFREILRDEVEHKDSGARELARLIRGQNAYHRAAQIIREVSKQRLRMRNEQFGFPLTENQLMALESRARRSVDPR